MRAARHRPLVTPAIARSASSPSAADHTGLPSLPKGFSQWWTALPAAEAESRVLSLPNTRASANPITDPWGPRTWSSRMVPLSGQDRTLNEFSVARPADLTTDNLVILHGYGAGLGFFYKNFEPLTRAKGWHLYALDLLGMGRSSRPPFRIQAKARDQQIAEAEDWFVDSLEEWRALNRIDKMTLLGHSMGGYMAVCYALKYPGRLNKLILASPVGIPEDPYAADVDMAAPAGPTLDAEWTQDQEADSTKAHPGGGPNAHRLSAHNTHGHSAGRNSPAPRRPLPRWLTYLWDANISPFSFVRLSGPLGPRLVSGWTSRRFSHLPRDEALALHDYAYSLFRMRGSGEYALAYILAPGAFARSPLIRRVQGLGRQTLANGERENGVPVVFMYGENDWMDINGGHAAKKKMDAVREKVLETKSAAARAQDRGEAKVVVIPKAGHHLYLDNPDAFNEVLRREMDDVQRRDAVAP
ncbi:hypothetical protein DV737_g3348, partial [Chaetothyriales sp. CBS 132003]